VRTTFDFTGQTGLVVGGGSGMGRTTALALAKAGARVAVADLSEPAGRETAALIQAQGCQAMFTRVDISLADQVQGMVRAVVQAWGRLDCAVNVAAVLGPAKELALIDEAEWDQVQAIDLKGTWLCLKHEILHMLEQEPRGETRGAIVNFGSISGVRARPNLAAYVAAKHGVLGLTKAAALEYSARGVRVNAVCPGAILTPMLEENLKEDPASGELMAKQHPVGRFGRPEEVAAAVLFLCSDQAAFIHGHGLQVDGGWNIQ
jgi:NAD(P)-dependent dehydrogenase (short-subunit alcohol dehydrogenase family)